MSNYPFNEGDDYWTIEDGEVIYSVWDSVSEELHDENPLKKYFKTKEEADLAKSKKIKFIPCSNTTMVYVDIGASKKKKRRKQWSSKAHKNLNGR